MMPKKPVELTQAEWTIIKAVWDKEPCTAPAIQQTLQTHTDWSYSTVRTLMDRIGDKGLLTAIKSGKHTLFRSAVTRRQAQHGEIALHPRQNAFNGALTPMVQCLLETGELSTKDLAELEALLCDRKRKEGSCSMPAFIEGLNHSWVRRHWRSPGQCFGGSSLLISVMFVVDWALRRRVRAAVRYALWWVVLLKLVLPPSLAFPTGPVGGCATTPRTRTRFNLCSPNTARN